MSAAELKSHIARRLIVYIIAFSSVVTLVLTAIQLYHEYDRDVSELNQYVDQIETGYLSGIAEAAWVVDERQLAIMLESISNLQDIEYISVNANRGDLVMEFGHRDDRLQIVRDIPLDYAHRGEIVSIGVLRIVAGLEGVYERLFNRIWVTLAANAFKTFVVALFVYYLFINLVTRHLGKIVDFTRKIDLERQAPTLKLDRDNDTGDELDVVSQALNNMVSELQNTYAVLRQSERRQKEVASSIPGVVFQLCRNSEGAYRILYLSDGVKTLFGLEASDVGEEAGILFAKIYEQDMESFFHSLKISAESLSPWFNEFRVGNSRLNGQQWVFGSAVPSINPEGGVCWNGIMLDISRQKHAEQESGYVREHLEEQVLERTRELELAKEEAVKANVAKSDFLSRMSHDLRTPLNAILGFSQLLEMKFDPNTPDHENIKMIRLGGEHLLTMISELLDLAKIEAGTIELDLEPVLIGSIIDETIFMVREQASQSGVNVVVEDFDDTLSVIADRVRMKEIFLNLMSNAIKYNAENGQVTVQVNRESANYACIAVIDTGPGIEEDKLSLLCAPFARLGAEHTDVEGTGIGLSIVKLLVELMDGKLLINSKIGEGSEFRVCLPCSYVDAASRRDKSLN